MSKSIRKSLCVLAALTAIPLWAAEENLVKNGSFEEGAPKRSSKILTGWYTPSKYLKYLKIDDTVAHTGKRSGTIQSDDETKGGYFSASTAEQKPGARLKLSVYYRFEALDSSAKAQIVIQCTNSQKRRSYGRLDLKPAADWTKAELFLQLSDKEPKGYQTAIQLKMNGKGKIWFDDLTVVNVAQEENIVEFYPSTVNYDNAVYPIKGESSPLIFHLFTNSKKENRVLTLDVPEGFSMTGAASAFAGYDKLDVQESRKEGRIFYNIKLSPKTILPIKQAVRALRVGTVLLFKANDNLKEGVINWSVNGIGSGKIKIMPQNPVKDKKLPKHFTLYSWYMPVLNFIPSESAVQDYIDTLKKSGVVGGSIYPEAQRAKLMNDSKFANVTCLWYETRNKCWTHMLNTPNLEKYLLDRLEGRKNFKELVMVWNYEPGLDVYYHFCDECRSAFEKETGKSLAGLKSGEEAEKSYPQEYMNFRNRQVKAIAEKFAGLCHKYGAKAILNSYVYSKSPNVKKNFLRKIGDVISYRKFLDSYSAQVYFQPEILWDQLAENLNYYPGMVVCYTSDERHNRMGFQYSLLTPSQAYIETVIAAILGSRTVHFFVGVHTFDGRQHNALRIAMDEISRYENFFFNGKADSEAVAEMKKSRHVRFKAFRHGGKVLLAIVNPDQSGKGFLKVKLTPGMKNFQIAEPEKKSVSRSVADGQEVLFELNPCEIRYILLEKPEKRSGFTKMELKTELAPDKEFKLLNEGGYSVTAKGQTAKAPETIQVKYGKDALDIAVNDGALVSQGSLKLFRDNLKVPADSSWSRDFARKYDFTDCTMDKGALKLTFRRELKSTSPAGLVLTKTLIFREGGKSIDAEIAIKNTAKTPANIAYWSWNQPGIDRKECTFDVPGQKTWHTMSVHKENNFFPVDGSSWGKTGNKYYFGWSAARPRHGGHEIEKFYIWSGGDFPTLELMGKKQEIKPGNELKLTVHFREAIPMKKPETVKPGQPFTIVNPYAVSRKLALRASPHNHAKHAPEYKHSGVTPAKRLEELRDARVTPRYGAVAITEHNRITLPENTSPAAKGPQWGVEGILFVPGIEKTMGSWTAGSAYGYLFGELNCVGVSREFKDPAKQNTYRHNNYPFPQNMKPENILGQMIDDGAYVGLCHPNAHFEDDGTQRWGSSGYNYDELDIIFGNSEKRMKALSRLPQGLEIGNQNYDFTRKSKFRNAEEKWDMLLSRGHRLWGTASDDAHHQAPMNGWCVMFMDELNEKEFMQSLLSGNFYASQGPELTAIKLDGKVFTVATDKPSAIEFIGKDGKVLQKTENTAKASYTIKGDELYVRARVSRLFPEKKSIGGGIGKRRSAWTNPLYIQQER